MLLTGLISLQLYGENKSWCPAKLGGRLIYNQPSHKDVSYKSGKLAGLLTAPTVGTVLMKRKCKVRLEEMRTLNRGVLDLTSA